MVLYSIYPPEVVLAEQNPSQPNYFTVELDGKTFVLELTNGQAKIVRLISANPDDYLRQEWQPGQTFQSVARNRVT